MTKTIYLEGEEKENKDRTSIIGGQCDISFKKIYTFISS